MPVHLTVVEWIAIAVFAAILLLATSNVRRQWRGEVPRVAASERTLRGRPSVVVAGWLMLVGVALTFARTSASPRRRLSRSCSSSSWPRSPWRSWSGP